MDIQDVYKLASATRNAGNLAAQRIAALWARLPTEDIGTLEDALYELYPRLIEEQAEVAASAALEWYENAREAERVSGAYTPTLPGSLVDGDEAASIVGAAVRDLRAGISATKALKRLQEGARKLVSDAGRVTMRSAAEKDPKPTKYARIPTGADTCAWCLTWAGRGFVYKTEETARFTRSHFKCDCQVVPSWSKQPRIRGYNSKSFEKLYRAAVDDLADEGNYSSDIKVIAARVRELFPDKVKDGHSKRGVSLDGTLQRPNLDKDRSTALAELKRRGQVAGSAYRIPPREMTQAPEWPKDLPPLRAKEWRHTLYGFESSGGHLAGYGWRFGRTEFPASWTEEDVLHAAEQILREKGLQVDTRSASAEGTVGGVKIRVAYRNDAKGHRIKTITPLAE